MKMNAPTQILKCQCGEFQMALQNFPQQTPGRLVCYCKDCQAFLRSIDRSDLLDANGGSEVIPLYPDNVSITKGIEFLKVLRLSPKGMFRFYTSCCSTPVCNAVPGSAWLGTHRALFQATFGERIERLLGPVSARVMGRYAFGEPPPGTADKMNLKALWTVLPFLIKGALTGRGKQSPCFKSQNTGTKHDCVVPVTVLTLEQRESFSARK